MRIQVLYTSLHKYIPPGIRFARPLAPCAGSKTVFARYLPCFYIPKVFFGGPSDEWNKTVQKIWIQEFYVKTEAKPTHSGIDKKEHKKNGKKKERENSVKLNKFFFFLLGLWDIFFSQGDFC